MIGQALGNYKVVTQLGSGSMGVVFLAEHQRIARRVAVKLLSPDLSQNAHALQRFFTEARATSLIRHPGIVDVFDCDVDASGRAYIVMELLEGETLGERLRRDGRLPWPAACAIAGRVAEAIGAAHDKGIIHRDLKPENVFLVGDPAVATGAPTVKVLDFGVAKLMEVDTPARMTVRGALLGTPEYMSPEQCGGEEEVDYRADVYALGCIVFEMLSGEPPFATSRIQELLANHMFKPAPDLKEQVADLPGWLADLVARMLSKEPGLRPASMHEIARALRAEGDAPRSSPPEPVRSFSARIAVAAAGLRGRGAHIGTALAVVFVLVGVVLAVRPLQRFGTKPPPKVAAVLTSVPAASTPDRSLPPPAPAPPPAPVVMPPAAAPVPAALRPPRLPGRRPAAPRKREAVDTDGIVDL
jgi:serine/threonine-protein kinase